MITTSTALHLAGSTDTSSPVPVLASRPRGVLHVVKVENPGRRFAPPTVVPVCNRPTRRLHLVADEPHPRVVGHHTNGQRLCARCTAQLVRAVGDRASWASHLVRHAKTHRTVTLAGGDAWAVEIHEHRVGVIAHTFHGWGVVDAGFGVPVDRHLYAQSSGGAIRILAVARELAHLPGGALDVVDGLTGVERAVLDLAAEVDAGKWAKADRFTGRRLGVIGAEIRRRFTETETRFYQQLQRLLDKPAAIAYAPSTVKHQRQRREQAAHDRKHPPVKPPASRRPFYGRAV